MVTTTQRFSFVALRLGSLSSVSWVTVEKVAQQVLWLVLFSILAPILGPGPYGVFSIVMVFIGFCELVLGDGMVEVLVTLVEFEGTTRGHDQFARRAGGRRARSAAVRSRPGRSACCSRTTTFGG